MDNKIIETVGILIALLSGAVWIGALTTQIRVLERDYEDMKEEIKNLKQQIMNPAAFIKVFETQLHNLKTKIAEVQQTVDSFKITELQTQVTDVEGKLNQLNQTLPNLKIKLSEVSQQALNLQKDYDAIKQQKQNTINETQNIKPQISAVEIQLHNIETKIAEVQQTVDKLKITELQTQVTDVEGKLNQLNQTLPNLKIQMSKASQQALSSIKSQTEQTVSEVKQEFKTIQQNIKALDINGVKSKLDQTKNELKVLNQIVVTLASSAVIRDRLKIGGFGPEMVIIPAGSFKMGGNNVSVEQFAMGKFEVTVGEYMKFVKATNTHAPEWLEKGSSYNIKTGSDNYYKKFGSALTNENHPIIGVSWYDAVAYTKWLNQQTGKKYRLPTEVEWEYAARADTTTKYWWGNDVGKNRANCNGCGSQWDNKSTSPVGSFSANPFGLYDTSGNVWEWTCSEYESKYNGKEKACFSKNTNKYRVLRGGSWDFKPRFVRTAFRSMYSPDDRNDNDGFRVVLASPWTN